MKKDALEVPQDSAQTDLGSSLHADWSAKYRKGSKEFVQVPVLSKEERSTE